MYRNPPPPPQPPPIHLLNPTDLSPPPTPTLHSQLGRSPQNKKELEASAGRTVLLRSATESKEEAAGWVEVGKEQDEERELGGIGRYREDTEEWQDCQ